MLHALCNDGLRLVMITGGRHGVIWKGRDYNASNWKLADGINRALSASNASLYALTAAVCCSMGFIPQLGFIHQAGTLPFIYDAADLYPKKKNERIDLAPLIGAFAVLKRGPDHPTRRENDFPGYLPAIDQQGVAG